jgi:Flp pilus assembly protein TadB
MIPYTIVVGVLSALGGLAVGYLGKRASENAASKALHGIERQITFNHAAKIAEFRQAWINDLREAMATFQSIGIPKDSLEERELRRIRMRLPPGLRQPVKTLFAVR